MRLIKKQDQAESQIQKLTFVEETKPFSRQETPAWMQAAATLRRLDTKPSHSDAAQIEKNAYEHGFREGEKAGLEIAERKIEAMMKRYADTILEVSKLKPTLYLQAEHDVVKLALEIAKKIVHREVRIDPEIIQTLVRVALSHVAVKSAVTIRLHPADYSYMLEKRAGKLPPGESDREMVLVADKSMERGGCLIEAESGDIDARIEEEFREVERDFFTCGE